MFYLCQLIAYFTIYSFLGWLVEVAYAYSISKKFVNRGFLFGPFCPIYGFGLLSLIVLLQPFTKNIFLFFIGAMLTTSAIEYFTGFILEKIFKTHWWDYSNEKFNLHGYICLKFSIYWGIFGTLLYYFIHPFIALLVNHIPQILILILAPLIFIYFLTDFTLTIKSLVNLKKIHQKFQKIGQKISSNSEFIKLKNEFDHHHIVKHFPQIKKLLP